jgi:hypothetical protein
MRTVTGVFVSLFLLAGTPSSGQSSEAQEERIAWQNVAIGRSMYHLPIVESLVSRFGDQAVEVLVPASFWCAISAKVDPFWGPESLCYVGDGTTTLYFTKPDDLFQWRTDRAPPLPPVWGPVDFLRDEEGIKLWRSRDPEISKDARRIYATFSDRRDVYAECDEQLMDRLHACEISWFDGEMIHRLSVPADWLPHVPAAIDEYRVQISPVRATLAP